MRTRFRLKIGAEVELELAQDKKSRRFRVVWQGEAGSFEEGWVGIEFADPNETWDVEKLQGQ